MFRSVVNSCHDHGMLLPAHRARCRRSERFFAIFFLLRIKLAQQTSVNRSHSIQFPKQILRWNDHKYLIHIDVSIFTISVWIAIVLFYWDNRRVHTAHPPRRIVLYNVIWQLRPTRPSKLSVSLLLFLFNRSFRFNEIWHQKCILPFTAVGLYPEEIWPEWRYILLETSPHCLKNNRKHYSLCE